jgi:hypothetical protein
MGCVGIRGELLERLGLWRRFEKKGSTQNRGKPEKSLTHL